MKKHLFVVIMGILAGLGGTCAAYWCIHSRGSVEPGALTIAFIAGVAPAVLVRIIAGRAIAW